ncbi:MAG: glycoside hydrolase family 9 protein [Cytophagaceae bacterium]
MKKLIFTCIVLLGYISSQAQHNYGLAQHLSTRFLGAQRCGNTKSWIQPETSNGCHTTDGQSIGRDLTGGWHDCGDYIKFHVTGPYTALVYLYGMDKFPEVYPDQYSQAYSKPPANGIPDVLDEVKIETDFLIKCVNGNTIYWQIGDGNDHNSFNEPISNSSQTLYNGSNIRTVYSATSGRSNAFGNSAAALALMSILYKSYDANYAQSCLNAAVSYYTIGKINPASTADARSTDGFYSWLANAGYADEMGLAAAMLYRATATNTYLTEATNYANSLSQSAGFDYGTMNHLLFYELYEITGTTTWLNRVASRVNAYTNQSCGYFHNTNWGSLRDAGNAAFLSALYHRSSGSASAYTFAKRNVDFILGTHNGIGPNAPANFSFLIGYNVLGGGFPKSPHHAAAFGKSSNAWTLYTQEGNNPGSVPFGYTLSGGLAGGPESACNNFHDRINNYVSSEYCSYYNAAFNGAVAYINKIENNITGGTRSPYGGSAHLIPGTIQFETYDTGGQNLSFYDTTPANEGGALRNDAVDIEAATGGGYNVGWTIAGEWLEYTVNVTQPGLYNLRVRHAGLNTAGAIRLSIGGNFVSPQLNLPATGGWQTWANTNFTNISLSQGEHILRVHIITGNVNLHHMEFTSAIVTGINKSIDTFKVYPNPATDRIFISNANDSNWEISDLSGRVLMNVHVHEGMEIDISSLDKGLYMLKDESGVVIRMFVKQ